MSDNPNSLFHPKDQGFALKEIVGPMDGEVIISKIAVLLELI